jgi:hypothetical protein
VLRLRFAWREIAFTAFGLGFYLPHFNLKFVICRSVNKPTNSSNGKQRW